jgi:hypothetical protein
MKTPKREQKSTGGQIFKNIGLGEFKVLALNPDMMTYFKLMDISEESQEKFKETEYVSDTKDGDTMIRLNFICEEVNTKQKFNMNFNLVDKIRVSQSGKTQWVNSVGDSAFVDSADNLQSWFKEFQSRDKQKLADKEYREAHQGEAELYTFMRTWLQGVDFYNPDVNILLDWNKLMRGNWKEIASLINTDEVNTFVAMVEVRVVEKEGEDTKHYSGIYSRSFLPGYKMRLIRNSITSGVALTDKGIIKFKSDIEGEYGCRNLFEWAIIHEFNPDTHIASGTKVLSTDDNSY